MEETRQYGLKEIKEMLEFVFALGGAIDKALADGKLDYMDTIHIVPALMKMGPAIENVKDIPKELKDLSDAEIEELKTWIADNFDIANDEIESYIEIGLNVVLSIYSLVKKITNKS